MQVMSRRGAEIGWRRAVNNRGLGHAFEADRVKICQMLSRDAEEVTIIQRSVTWTPCARGGHKATPHHPELDSPTYIRL